MITVLTALIKVYTGWVYTPVTVTVNLVAGEGDRVAAVLVGGATGDAEADGAIIMKVMEDAEMLGADYSNCAPHAFDDADGFPSLKFAIVDGAYWWAG